MVFAGFLPIALGMVVAFGFSAGLVATQSWHGRLTMDSDSGIQKVHTGLVPRVGGLALATGYFAAWLAMDGEAAKLFGLIGLAGLPALLAGLLEDVTKQVGVKARLMATILSGMIFVLVSGYAITRVEIALLAGWLLLLPVVALVFSGVAMGGVAIAVNFVDGFHGLASGSTIIALLGFALVGARAGDVELGMIALVLAALVAGFFVVNFPFGKLFLGDGGAFFVGYLLAALAVMLPARNPEISPWVSVVILGYPLVETLFTIVRRLRKGPGQWKASESAHLHHLVHQRWAQATGLRPPVLQNALTSVFVWSLPLSAMIFVSLGTPARSGALGYLVALVLVYGLWYWRLAAAAQPRPVAL